PDDDLGPLQMLNALVRLTDTPAKIRWTGRGMGADTHEILVNELGLSEETFDDLRQRGVIA
ncbi:MAG: CoA transferase, partial [Ilumatobacteraceae bacterium]